MNLEGLARRVVPMEYTDSYPPGYRPEHAAHIALGECNTGMTH